MVIEAALLCLAQNIYFEARDQSTAGQIATANVVMNRVKSKHYPDNVCDVVKQGPTRINWKGNELPVRDKCQFSWYCDGKSDEMYDPISAVRAQELAYEVFYGNVPDLTDGATHYHAVTVYPRWAFEFHITTRIDDHIFYRNK